MSTELRKQLQNISRRWHTFQKLHEYKRHLCVPMQLIDASAKLKFLLEGVLKKPYLTITIAKINRVQSANHRDQNANKIPNNKIAMQDINKMPWAFYTKFCFATSFASLYSYNRY